MRILFTADPEISVPPTTYGGVQRLVDAILREMKARGHTVGLVAHPDSSSPANEFWPFPGLESQKAWDTCTNTLTLTRAIRQFRPDVIHSFSRLMYLLPILGSRIPKLMTYGRYPGARGVRMGSFLSAGSLEFTACSNHIKQIGQKGGGRWHTVYNFVELDLFTYRSEVSRDAPLVFLSRLDRVKGAHSAIAAAKAAGERLIIAGNHALSGPDAEYFEEEIEPQLGRDGIEYVGPVNDGQKNELLGAAKALMVPIEWEEPFGIVFIEALACGTPVISTPRGAVPEIMQDGVHGFIVQGLEQTVAAIHSLSEIDRLECRKTVEERFTASVVIDHYEKIYQNLTSKQGNGV